MLRPIHARTQLEWVQPDPRRAAFELRAEHDLVGALQQCEPGGTRFLAQTADGVWTFTRSSRRRPRVLVSRIDEARPLAVFQTEGTSGSFVLKNGRVYTWLSRTGWFHDGLWTDDQACVLIRLCIPEGLTTAIGHVNVVPAASALPELPLLILLGWYLLVRELEDFLVGVQADEQQLRDRPLAARAAAKKGSLSGLFWRIKARIWSFCMRADEIIFLVSSCAAKGN